MAISRDLFQPHDDAPALRWILDQLGAPYGWSVQMALGTYDASLPTTLGLRHMRPEGIAMMPVEDHLAALRLLRIEYAAELNKVRSSSWSALHAREQL